MSNIAEHPEAPLDPTSGAAAKPKLLDEVGARIRRLNYSIRTEDIYADWVRPFVLFRARRHPREKGATQIWAFLRTTQPLESRFMTMWLPFWRTF